MTPHCAAHSSADKNQSWYPCNLVKECWCWDTTGPRDPGDELNMDIACSGCGRGGDTEICVSNQNSLIPVGDEECKKCQSGQSFWPCDDRDLCWCWDTTKPKKPPAPASGLKVAAELDPSVKKPCEIFTKTIFNQFAPNSTFPYTYEGLCNAIDDYNTYHTEKFAAMGTEQHIKHELAAWLGNVAHESDDFEAGREYLGMSMFVSQGAFRATLTLQSRTQFVAIERRLTEKSTANPATMTFTTGRIMFAASRWSRRIRRSIHTASQALSLRRGADAIQ